ncbi:MAG TPA: hypothetical protein DCG53_14045 [Syntrophus sp. (in: bacteria)]|nr:hypothetical protein [Syntrophus sp. (in: bacteria)]
MLVDKYEIGKKMIALAEQYSQMGDKLSINADKQLTAGEITDDKYHELCSQVDKIFKQATVIHKEVAKLTAGSIEADLDGIENVTKDMEEAVERINRIKNIVNITMETITAVGTVVLACSTPNPATILAAVAATQKLANDIIAMTGPPVTVPPIIPGTQKTKKSVSAKSKIAVRAKVLKN